MKPASSLFTKILSWFFLNLVLVGTLLSVFFAFQPQVNLHAIFGQQGSIRLRTAGMLIAHDLSQVSRLDWSDVLARHAMIHGIDFAIVFQDGSYFSSTKGGLPKKIMTTARIVLRHKPPGGPFPPARAQQLSESADSDASGSLSKNRAVGRKQPMPGEGYDKKPLLTMRTRNPSRYWSGIRIPLSSGPSRHPVSALLLAVSGSVTGNGFFFDPLPWMVVAAVVIVISVLFWIPMVRNITRPLRRMTRATEEIAQGRFDVAIGETRSDEIGRLAQTINHMAERLSGFVNGQKRFLGDVAHELGSPIARIQFGLGALEQRTGGENRQRVIEVMEDVENLSKLVNELLAFSRADMKSDTVKLEIIDLLPVVQTAVKREVTPTARVVVQIDPEIRVVASTELLTRAISNLLRNAIKYAGDAGPIYISNKKKDGRIAISMLDSGPGVPEEYLDQLFEPFFRPEPSRERNSGGVGLGLAIVKTCIETCKGTVTAHNRKPNGFAVTITLIS